jgi:AcrR family transcriptional regulator
MRVCSYDESLLRVGDATVNPRGTGASRRPGNGRPSDRAGAGRSNQKERTRTAIVAAAREAMTAGGEVTMPGVASRALVSEATAYRYFPDLASLLHAALAASLDSPEHAMAPVAHSEDPIERIGFATEIVLREVMAYQSAVRAMVAAAVSRPVAVHRPGRRFGLIDEALRPLEDSMAVQQPARFAQLKRGLAVVVSAETLFTLTDQCGLTPELAIASAIETARSLTAAAIRPVPR